MSCGISIQQPPVALCRRLYDDSSQCKLIVVLIYIFLVLCGQVIIFLSSFIKLASRELFRPLICKKKEAPSVDEEDWWIEKVA